MPGAGRFAGSAIPPEKEGWPDETKSSRPMPRARLLFETAASSPPDTRKPAPARNARGEAYVRELRPQLRTGVPRTPHRCRATQLPIRPNLIQLIARASNSIFSDLTSGFLYVFFISSQLPVVRAARVLDGTLPPGGRPPWTGPVSLHLPTTLDPGTEGSARRWDRRYSPSDPQNGPRAVSSRLASRARFPQTDFALYCLLYSIIAHMGRHRHKD